MLRLQHPFFFVIMVFKVSKEFNLIYYPAFGEFKLLASKGNIVPVYRRLIADTLTPVSAFQKISDSDHAFLLESAAGGEKISRYSILGSNPFIKFTAFGNNVEILHENSKKESVCVKDPLEFLNEKIREFTPVQVNDLPKFYSCVVGYIGYDAIRYIEELPNVPKDDLLLPDIQVMFYDSIIIFDNLTKTINIVSSAKIGSDSLENLYTGAIKKIDNIIKKFRTPVMSLCDDVSVDSKINIQFTSNFGKADFLKSVGRCKEYICAGDIFQAVISQRLKTQTNTDSFSIYRVLRVVNPSPYMFYLKMGNLKLIGASPEVMVKVEGKDITVRPIAGTRKRGKDDVEDMRLEQELISDPKERAEHIMLLDLGRNDVGRVSRYGSVRIDEKMVIEKYSHVMHITSSVCGKLREDKSAFDSLKACLPAGTLTGAPKIRAMEIIDEIEPTKRGPYGGAVGYFDFFGGMNTCITIRTIILKGNEAYIQAGAGIVADSVPEREYEETMNKAKGLLKAIELADKINMGK